MRDQNDPHGGLTDTPESGLDFVSLGDHHRARSGLHAMLDKVDLDRDGDLVEVETALLIVEIAKRAPDTETYFPCGKWATIHALRSRCEAQLERLDRTRWGK